MRTPATLALAALVLLAATGCQAALDMSLNTTMGQRDQGYTYASNVLGYVNMNLDTCDMFAALADRDLAGAQAIYTTGKNSVSGSSLRAYRSWALAKHTGEQTYDALVAYHSPANISDPTFLDAKIAAAFDAGRGARAVSLNFAVNLFKYMLHEVDTGLTRLSANLTNVTTGAPHVVDEAVAIWLGGHPASCAIGAPAAAADKLAQEMGTAHNGESPINLQLSVYFNDLLHYSMKDNSSANVAAYDGMRVPIHQQIAMYHAQGVLRNAYASEAADLCSGSKHNSLRAERKEWAQSYYDALAPVMKLFGASDSQLAAVGAQLTASKVSYTKTRAALLRAWTAAKLPSVNLGKPSFNAIRPSAKDCKKAPKA